MKLNIKKRGAAKATDKDYKLTDGNSLYLYITKGGIKSWRFKYTFNKKQKLFVVGKYSEISLADARFAKEELKK